MGAQGNDFRYYLTLNNKRTEIIFAPDGWDSETIVSYKRSTTYFGMIRSFSLPLDFVLDGANILRSAYYTYGIEAEVRLEVEVLNKKGTPIWGYLPFFIGDVDFSDFKDFEDHVSVTLMESGISRALKAFEGIKYEYSLTGNDVVTMELPGVAFEEKGTSYFVGSIEENFNSMPGLEFSGDGLTSGVVTAKSTQEHDGIDLNPDNGFWFLKINRLQIVKITGSIKGKAFTRPVQNSATFFIEIRNQVNQVVYSIGSVSSPETLGNTPFEFSNISHQQAYSEDTFLYVTVRGTGDNDNYLQVTEGSLNISFTSISDPTECKGINSQNLFKRIIKKISPSSETRSYLLSTTWKNLIFTSGDGIRQIEDAKIKITFKEFYETINAICDAGFGTEKNAAVLEASPYFSRDIEIIDLGEVKTFLLNPAEDFIFNSIKIGYNDGNTDEDNGKEEYNSGQVWAMPITRIQKEKNWISPTRADQYGIEKLRVDVVKKVAADTSSDNDTFMIDCVLDGELFKPVLGASYEQVEGLTSGGTAYNLNLSPKKNLQRHSGYLRGVLDRMDGRYISFASGDKNTELLTVKNSIRVKENEDIVSSSLNGKYFIPNIATITAPINKNVFKLIDSTPYGWVRFKYKNTVVKGYILELSVDIARNTAQEIKLLLTNDNNLLGLV